MNDGVDFGRIRAVALDVDGVLTDGAFWWGPNGEEWKRFSFMDVMGISLGKKAGLVFALISAENSPLVDRFADKMGITDVFKGCRDKAVALREFADRHKIGLRDIVFMGDDVNDLEAMACAGVSAAPATAAPAAFEKARYVSRRAGGHGAVREMLDLILQAKLSSI